MRIQQILFTFIMVLFTMNACSRTTPAPISVPASSTTTVSATTTQVSPTVTTQSTSTAVEAVAPSTAITKVLSTVATTLPSAAPVPTAAACGKPANWVIHLVRSGDTLSQLAVCTGTTVDAIMRANCKTSTMIVIGERLALPQLPYTCGVAQATPGSKPTVPGSLPPTGPGTPRLEIMPINGTVGTTHQILIKDFKAGEQVTLHVSRLDIQVEIRTINTVVDTNGSSVVTFISQASDIAPGTVPPIGVPGALIVVAIGNAGSKAQGDIQIQ